MTRRGWSLAGAAVTLAAAARLLMSTVADPDLWGHIRFGQRTLALGLERTDPFSYLSGHDWINHEILSEVAFALAFDFGGGTALILLKTIIGVGLVGLMYAHLIARGSDPLKTGLLLLPSLLLLIPGLVTVRPQMFTFLFFCLTILLLHRAETHSDRWLWALPPLFALWINFHGGVLAGAGILGVWAIGRICAGFAERGVRGGVTALRTPLLLGVGCAAALLVNPYGWHLPAFLLRTATIPRPDIVEWHPLGIVSAPGLIYLAVVVVGAWSVLRAPGRIGVPLLAVLVALVILPLTAVRHLQLFAIGVPVVIADAFAEAWKRESVARPAAPQEARVVAATAVLAAVLLIGTGLRDARCIRIAPSPSLAVPMRAVAWLSQSGVEGNLATFFDWGEYALWHLAPRIRISMDGRRETVYPDSIRAEYLRFQDGRGAWRGLLDRPETDMVLFPRGWPGYNLTAGDAEWRQVYGDSLAGVFVRRGGRQSAALEATVPPQVPIDGGGLCVS